MSATKWPEDKKLFDQLLEEASAVQEVAWGTRGALVTASTTEDGEISLKLKTYKEEPET